MKKLLVLSAISATVLSTSVFAKDVKSELTTRFYKAPSEMHCTVEIVGGTYKEVSWDSSDDNDGKFEMRVATGMPARVAVSTLNHTNTNGVQSDFVDWSVKLMGDTSGIEAIGTNQPVRIEKHDSSAAIDVVSKISELGKGENGIDWTKFNHFESTATVTVQCNEKDWN